MKRLLVWIKLFFISVIILILGLCLGLSGPLFVLFLIYVFFAGLSIALIVTTILFILDTFVIKNKQEL